LAGLDIGELTFNAKSGDLLINPRASDVPGQKSTVPIWMAAAQRAADTLRATTRGSRRASHSVYVVLLHDPAFPARWGLYVGQTARDPDWRFHQHKLGYKASGAVRKFGVSLLPKLVQHLNPMQQWKSLELEAALANAFRSVGVPWVEGGH
jgi:hypothetical protein